MDNTAGKRRGARGTKTRPTPERGGAPEEKHLTPKGKKLPVSSPRQRTEMRGSLGLDANIPPALAEAGKGLLPMPVMTDGTMLRARTAEGVTTVQAVLSFESTTRKRGEQGGKYRKVTGNLRSFWRSVCHSCFDGARLDNKCSLLTPYQVSLYSRMPPRQPTGREMIRGRFLRLRSRVDRLK